MPPLLGEWAEFEKSVNGFKLHFVFENTLDIPEFCQLSLGEEQELTIAKKWIKHFPNDRIMVFDRAYFSWEFLNLISKAGNSFIVPAKRNLAYEVECEVPVELLPEDVLADQIVVFTSQIARKYQPVYRRVVHRDPKSSEPWVYITNLINLDAEIIVEAYRQRWKIEIFFKWIKQNLNLKSF